LIRDHLSIVACHTFPQNTYREFYTEKTVLLKYPKIYLDTHGKNGFGEKFKILPGHTDQQNFVKLNQNNYVERSARISKFFAALLIVFKVSKLF